MKIIKIQVLRGPNVWSNYRKKLIQMRLDLEEMEEYPTDKIPGFRERLQELIPSLVEHECSEGERGGFFRRVEMGTWMGHVIEHIALEIQTVAGMFVGYGRTRSTKEHGVYNVVFAYEDEEVGIYAAKAAVRIAEALIKGEAYDLCNDIKEMKEIHADNAMGPSTKSIVDEAVKRGIPYVRLGNDSLVQLGYGASQMRFQATMTCKTSNLAVDLACDKDRTKEMLNDAGIPVPTGGICTDEESLKEIIDEIGYPVVLKPLDGNQGKGATINITTWEEALGALTFAKSYGRKVMVERYISGYDFRVLVIDNKFVAAAKRVPAHVVGNGVDTIATLIDIVNHDTRRGDGHENVLTKIKINRDSEEMLVKQRMELSSVPSVGQVVYLKSTANLSTGGSAIDATDEVHPDNIALAERIARVIGLDICGIDIMAQTLSEPVTATGGAVLEVNAAPGFRMHLAPTEGQPRNVAAPVVDMLFPPTKPSRIPIIAVTGTNGKTTTTRLLAHIAQTTGFSTGYTTTDGIYVNGERRQKGDTTGPVSAEYILKDPTVEFAVLETARGGILRSGMAFDCCDVGIITNIKEDHLGLNDIHTLDDLAQVKGVVARAVKKDGYAVLNAEDPHCVAIAGELDCNVAYFSMDENNENIQKLVAAGKAVAIFENNFITIIKGSRRTRVINVANVPLTLGGKVRFNIANAMAAALAAYLWGFTARQIAHGLETFVPSYEQTPGRLNHFEFSRYNVIVDYAHNPHGYSAMEDYLKNVTAGRKVGIISGVGDRRDEDIKECALIAGRMFDHVIIRQDDDLRGRTEEDITRLLLEGLNCCEKHVTYEMVYEEASAIRHAMEHAVEGDLIVALTDKIDRVVAVVKEFQAREDAEAQRMRQSA